MEPMQIRHILALAPILRRRNFAPISLSYRDPHFGLFGGFGGFGGYVATSDAKSDVITG